MINSAYIRFFKALCNDTRLAIIVSLKESPKNVTQLVKELKLEQSRVSHNLKCLEFNGFVKMEKKGKQRFYSLNGGTIEPILDGIEKHIKKYGTGKC